MSTLIKINFANIIREKKMPQTPFVKRKGSLGHFIFKTTDLVSGIRALNCLEEQIKE